MGAGRGLVRIELDVLDEELRKDLTFLLKCELDKNRFVLVDEGGDLVITDRTPSSDRLCFKVSSMDDVKELIRLFKRVKLKYISKPGSLIIGIDPGKRLGCVLLINGRVSGSYVTNSPDDLIEVLLEFLEVVGLKGGEALVKIGRGPRFDEVISRLKNSGFSKVLVVGEEGSSSKGLALSKRFGGDVGEEEASALIIALREP